MERFDGMNVDDELKVMLHQWKVREILFLFQTLNMKMKKFSKPGRDLVDHFLSHILSACVPY